jgi:hypothetical protein
MVETGARAVGDRVRTLRESGVPGDKVMAGLKNMVTRRNKAAQEFGPVSKAKIAG